MSKRAQVEAWLNEMDAHHARGGIWSRYGLALTALRRILDAHSKCGPDCGTAALIHDALGLNE